MPSDSYMVSEKNINIQSEHNEDPKENFEEKLLFYFSN